MSYDIAKAKAWDELVKLESHKALSVKFLADEYTLDTERQKILSLSCNTPIKDFPAILILHYLIQKLKGLPPLIGEWLTFREFSGVEGYASAFKRRAIEPIIKKYGKATTNFLDVLDRLPGKRVEGADISIVLNVFEGVPVLVQLWRSDEEFGPDANMLFDKSITKIFCTEDIVVLAGIIASSL